MCFSTKLYTIVLLPVWFVFLLNNPAAFAQTQIIYQQFTSDQGLSENVVYCLLQDKRGFIWAGTHHGLNRYDGYSFKKYYANNDDSTSLSDNTINTMVQDEYGKFWIGTSGGLNHFDPETGINQRITIPGKDLGYGVGGLHFINKDSLLVNTGNGEIYLFEIAGKRWIKTTINKQLSLFGKFFSIERTGTGIGLMGYEGLLLYDVSLNEWTTHLQKESLSFKKGNYVSNYYNDKKGNQFLFSRGKSFEVFDSKGTKLAMLNQDLFNSVTPPDIYAFAESADADVWVATTMGLLQFNHANQTFSFRELVGDSKSLKGNKEIRCLLKDKDDNLWLGTFGEGILKCRIQKSPFSSIGLEEMTAANFQRMIYGLYQWPGGEIAAETGFRNFSIIRNNKLIGYTNSNKMGLDKIFYVTTGKKMEEISKVQQTIARHLFNGTILLPNQFLLHDSDAIAVTSPSFTIFRQDTGFGNSYYTTNAFDDGKFYWAACTNGLLRIDKKNLNDTLFVHVSSNPFSLNENYLYCIIGDEKNNLWIGTKGGGLNYFDRQQQKFYHYTTQDGLPDNVIYFIVPDKKGNLWVSTNNGLSRFNIAGKTFQNFSRRDGLLNSEFNRNGGVLTEDGTMYFSGTSGIDYFKPEEIASDTITPGAYFSSLQVNGKEVPFTNSSYQHFRNNISFFFTANDFTRPDLVYYRYRLKGIANEWVRIQGINYVSFNVLPPGRYSMEIQSSYNNLQWSNSAVYGFIILTPWWNSWWFYTLCALVIAVAIYLFYRYRIRQLKKVQALRTRISQDLHDEVGATLTSISFLSEVARKYSSGENSPLVDTLGKIGAYSREMIGEMNDIVWAINPANDKFNKITDRMMNFALPLCSAKNIQINFETEEDLKNYSLGMEQRKNLYLIFKEAINNAAKYSDCSSIHVTLKKERNKIVLMIADNGRGFDPENSTDGNGLKNMKERAGQANAAISLQSSPGKGAKIMVQMPITQNADMTG